MERIDWFDIWFADKQSILDTMIKNMQSDLEAGYDPNGASIVRQQCEINLYKNQFDSEIEMLKEKDSKAAAHWCRLDMKKRGAID